MARMGVLDSFTWNTKALIITMGAAVSGYVGQTFAARPFLFQPDYRVYMCFESPVLARLTQ